MKQFSSMRLPDFLVIGAMKCGTTTLYHDLIANPLIFILDKESNFLLRDISQRQLAAAFRKAKPWQVCGDVSADYTTLPQSADVAPRAKRLLGSATSIFYIVREPVARTISHHHHLNVRRDKQRIGADINLCVVKHPALINCSRYAMQLRPWLDSFGKDAVHVIRFEDFVQQRVQTIERVCAILGVPACSERIAANIVHNRSERKPVLNRFWHHVTQNRVYRRVVRPILPLRTRDKLRRAILPKAPGRPAPPRFETVEYLVEQLRNDGDELQHMLGLNKPFWDLDAILESYRTDAPQVVAVDPHAHGENPDQQAA